MARNPEKNLELKEISIEKILQTGIILFAKRGFAAAKTTEIVKEAGISQGLLYHYFPDKEKLYEECVRRCIRKSKEYIIANIDEMTSAADQIIHFTEKLFGQLEKRDVLFYQFILLIRLTLEMKNEDLVREYEDFPIKYFSKIIEDAQREGRAVEGDSVILANLYFSIIKGICIQLMNPEAQVPNTNMICHILLI